MLLSCFSVTMASLGVFWTRPQVTLVLMVTMFVFATSKACSGDTCVNSTHYQTCTGLVLACDEARSCFSESTTDLPCLPNPPSCTQPGAFHFQNECDRFYICTKSRVSFVIFCPPGLHFYKLENGVGHCTEPERANCFKSSTVSPPTSLTTTAVPQVTTEMEDVPPELPSSILASKLIKRQETLVPKISDFTIRPAKYKKPHIWEIFTTVNYGTMSTPVLCSEEGRFAMENNCRQYVLCIRRSKLVGIEPVIKTCPFRQLFDSRLRLCRHNIKCGSKFQRELK
ncbi:hypothetical protein B566_EDAN001978 [Ephemera danica]|nr:hypothetical protein B566_EDAN001978 [Ephemera danica]